MKGIIRLISLLFKNIFLKERLERAFSRPTFLNKARESCGRKWEHESHARLSRSKQEFFESVEHGTRLIWDDCFGTPFSAPPAGHEEYRPDAPVARHRRPYAYGSYMERIREEIRETDSHYPHGSD